MKNVSDVEKNSKSDHFGHFLVLVMFFHKTEIAVCVRTD